MAFDKLNMLKLISDGYLFYYKLFMSDGSLRLISIIASTPMEERDENRKTVIIYDLSVVCETNWLLFDNKIILCYLNHPVLLIKLKWFLQLSIMYKFLYSQ